jgi:ankyrin repeat protein
MPSVAQTDPVQELARAVRTDDAAGVRRVLREHPELKARLDQALPDAAFGATALLESVYHKNREILDLLLDAGADINVRSDWWAGSFGVLDSPSGMEDYLISRGATLTPHAAARLGRVGELKRMLDANPALIHERGGDGQTPLHFAHSIGAAELLLAYGADIDARDIDHESTPAQWMLNRAPDVARYLVTRGCSTDILMAAALGDLPLVQHHLETDPAVLRMSVSDAWFPKQNPRSAGTIYQWTLAPHKTAHFIAHKFGHGEIYRWLMARSPADLQFTVACEVGDEPLLETLLSTNPRLLEGMSEWDRQKLPIAAKDANLAAVRLMLHHGWPVDTRGNEAGATALHWAAFQGHAELIREILSHNPDVSLKSLEYPGTALDWAVYGSKYGWHPEQGDYVSTVEQLLRSGAKAPAVRGDLIASEAVLEVLRRNA